MFARLTKIKIENFKSFKETTEVTFKPFTALTGRNGSGKSNLLDCIYFAFGGNAKELRCNKISDLIFGSNSSLQLSNSASVTVYLDLEEDGEKKFTRVITQSSCQYFIDDEVTSHKTFLGELKALGIDISAQSFYIMQGTVENTALKSPNELMSLFEIISGSYVLKGICEKFQKQFNEVADKLHYINKKKSFFMLRQHKLKQYMKEEEKYEQMLKTLNSRQEEAYLIRILIIKKQMDNQEKITTEIQSIKRKKELCREQVASLIKFKLLKEQTIQDFECSLKIEEMKLEKNQDVLNEINDEISEKTIQIDKYTLFVEKGLNDINNFDQQITELQRVLLITNEDIKAHEASVLPDHPMLDQKQMHEYFTLEEKLKMQTSDLPKELQILRTKQSEDEDKLKWESSSLETVMKKEKMIDLRLKELENKRSSIKSQLLDCQNNKDKVISQINRSKEIIQKLNSEQCSLQDKLKEVTTQLKDISMDKNTEILKNERISTLEKLKSEFSGVYGRVIDICNPISSKYRTCVTKVFGKHMMSIIVANSYIAKKCIQFLKQYKLSRETFLPLDNIHPTAFNHELRYIRKPEGIIPIRDLLRYNIQYEKIINYIAGNTLACKTANDARYVAYTLKFKTVSLDGCSFNPSGIISGGELDLKNKGGLWDQDFAKLNKEKTYLTEELQNTIKTQKLELKTQNYLTTKSVALQTKIECYQEYIKNIESIIFEDTKELKQLQKRKMKIEENIGRINEELNKRNALINEMKEKYNNEKKHIFKDFFSKLGILPFNFDDIRRSYDLKMDEGITLSRSKYALEHQIEYELKQKMETEEKVMQWKDYIEKYITRLAILKASKASLNEEINNIQASMHKIKELLKVYKTELSNFNKLKENSESQLESLSSDELLLLKKDALINTEREGMQEELRSILLGCQTIGIRLPIKNDGSFKQAVQTAIAGENINVDFDYSCLPPEIYSLPPEELIIKHREMHDDINVLKIKTHEKSVNWTVSEEKVNETTEQLIKISKEHKRIRQLLNDVDKRFKTAQAKRTDIFMELFNKISENLHIIYQDLNNTKLNCTSLTLENDTDIFSGGIYFSYSAPGKPCTPVTSLSVGESALAGITLLYAILSCSKYHLLLLDEIDSSLDSTIIEKISLFLNKHKQNVQVLAASHNEKFYHTSDQMLMICLDKKDDFKLASKVISYSFE